MAGRSIGATLVLNAGNFFANMRSASSETNKLKRTLSGAVGGVRSFSSGISSAGNAVSGIVKKVAGAAAAYVSLRSAINFGKDIVNTGVQFEQSMANVSAISGVTGDEFKSLSDKAIEMGATTKFSAIEAADSFTYMAQAGWKTNDMINGVSGIMNMAAASGMDLANATSILTGTMAGFGLSATGTTDGIANATYAADILAATASNANTDIAMMGESFKNVAPTAQAMGYGIKDTAVALGLMANANILGGEAGTSLNAVMTRLAKPTKDVKTAISELGISAVNADGSMKPLSKLIPELQSKFSTLTASQKGQYATMIAGKNAMSGFLSIVNSSPEDFQKLTDAIDNSNGAAQRMADTMNDTVSGKLTLLKSQFEGVKIAIFNALGSSQFKGVLQSMSDGLTAITPALETVTVAIGNGLFNAIQGISNIASNVFGSVKTAIENNQPAINNLKNAFDNVKNTIANAFSGEGTGIIQTLADTAVPTLCNALSAAMDIVSGIIDHWDTLEPILKGALGAFLGYKALSGIAGIAEKAGGAISTFEGGLGGVQTAFGNFKMSLMGLEIAKNAGGIGTLAKGFQGVSSAGAALGKSISGLGGAFGGLGSVMTFVTSPVGLVVLGIGVLIATFAILWNKSEAFRNFWKGLWENVKNAAGVAVEKIKAAVIPLKDSIVGAFQSAWEMIKVVWVCVGPYFQALWNTLKSYFSVVKVYIGGAFKTAWAMAEATWNNVTGYFTALFNTLKGVFSLVKNVLSGNWSAAWEDIKGIAGTWVGFFSGIWDGIKNIFSAVKDWFGSTFGAAWNGIKDIVGIWGEFFSGIWGCIKDIFSPIGEWFGSVFTAAQDSTTGAFSGISGFFSGIWESITGVFSGVGEWFSGIFNSAWNGITGVFSSVGEFFSGIWESIVGVFSGIGEWFSGVFSAAWDFIKTSYNEGALKPIVDKIVNTFGKIKNAAAEEFGKIRGVVSEKISAAAEAANGFKEKFTEKFNSVKEDIAERFNGTKELVGEKISAAAEAVNGIKERIADKFSDVKGAVIEQFSSVKDGVITVFTPLGEAVASIINGIKTVISTIVDGIKTYIINTVENIKTTVTNIIEGVKQNFINFFTSIQTAFQGVWTGITTVFEGIKTVIVGVFQVIVGIFTLNTETIKTGLGTIKDGFNTAFEGAKIIVLNVWNAIKAACQLAFDNVKTVVANVISGVKTQFENIRNTVSNVFQSVWNTISGTFENVKSKVFEVFENVKNTISGAIETIKGFFKFDWELPKIKLPHFSISGSFSLNPPSIPTIGVDWYAKGGIMTRPTIFGINGNNIMAGGEAGAEAVLPLDTLWSKLGEFMQQRTQPEQSEVNTYTINVYANFDSGDDYEKGNRLAQIIVDKIKNM